MKRNIFEPNIIFMIALITTCLFCFSACGTSPSMSDTVTYSDEYVLLDGFQIYEDKNSHIKLQYPKDWAVLNKDILATDKGKETLANVSSVAGMDSAIYATSIQSVSAVWYDIANSKDGFTPNLNLLVEPSKALTPETFLDDTIREQVIDSIESQFTSSSFQDYKKLADPELKQLGSNVFLTFQSSYSMGYNAESYLALTVINGNLYTFTFSTGESQLVGLIPKYDEVLSTVRAN